MVDRKISPAELVKGIHPAQKGFTFGVASIRTVFECLRSNVGIKASNTYVDLVVHI